MIRTNTNYLQLSHRYLFAEIAQQVNAYKAEHPEYPENVFVCGDAANGASLVVRAIASGLQAADRVHLYLQSHNS